MQVQAIINYFFIYISKDTCKNSSSEIFEIKDVPSTYDKSTKNLVVIIRLGYTHRFYKNAFSKTVLDTSAI